MENLNKTNIKSAGRIFRQLVWLAVAALSIGLPARGTAAPAGQASMGSNALLNEPWSPEKLYAILSSPNPGAREHLYRAAFAAGPPIIPKLETALKDDRTAEFAAQTLAYLGGESAIDILAKLVKDPRDLDLRRFYYGALGGSDNLRNIEILLNKIRTSDREPDRTVTQDAILALSISSDPALVPKLRQAEKEVTDPVIQDDINTAATVIGLRAKYLESPAGRSAGSSLLQAIRTYFMPALEGSPEGDGTGQENSQSDIQIKIHTVTYSPDKARALAAVDFEDPQAVAHYQIVLQKHRLDWTVSSVWLGQELEKHPEASKPAKPQ